MDVLIGIILVVGLLVAETLYRDNIIEFEQQVKQDLFDITNEYIRKKGW